MPDDEKLENQCPFGKICMEVSSAPCVGMGGCLHYRFAVRIRNQTVDEVNHAKSGLWVDSRISDAIESVRMGEEPDE